MSNPPISRSRLPPPTGSSANQTTPYSDAFDSWSALLWRPQNQESRCWGEPGVPSSRAAPIWRSLRRKERPNESRRKLGRMKARQLGAVLFLKLVWVTSRCGFPTQRALILLSWPALSPFFHASLRGVPVSVAHTHPTLARVTHTNTNTRTPRPHSNMWRTHFQ